MARDQKRDALQLIFSFFLGVLLTVFIGVGVWTFYPDPVRQGTPLAERRDELFKKQEQISIKSGKDITPAEQQESARIQDEIEELDDVIEKERGDWAVVTSIILISFATLLMVVSLLLPEAARVISNGVLLGGLLSMIYGTGWSFAGGDSRARFAVVSVALLLTLVFGFIRFVIMGRRAEEREERLAAASASGSAVPVGSVAPDDASSIEALAARVAHLEARAEAAAAALGGREDERRV